MADSNLSLRVLETSHPPAWYVPREDVRMDLLRPTSRQSVCEFKGQAGYFTISAGGLERRDAAWSYERPLPGYEALAGQPPFAGATPDAGSTVASELTIQMTSSAP